MRPNPRVSQPRQPRAPAPVTPQSPRPDFRADATDIPLPFPLAAALADDLARHLDLARRVLPECPHADILRARLASLLRACERPPVVAVEDWRSSSARLGSSDEASSDGSAPDGIALACANDVVAALTPSDDLGGSRPAISEAPPEMVRGDGASRTPRAIDAWWFADAIVVVASATRERTRRENTSTADKSNDDVSEQKKPFPEQRPDRSRNEDGSRTDASTQHPPPRDANAPRGARRFWSSQAFAKSPLAEDSLAAAATAARQLGPLGADSTFVIVQDCESAREARDARGCLVHAGLAESNVFCLEKSLDEEVRSDGRIGASFREWREAWGRDRARRVARDYAPVRDCVRFWASFGTVEDDGGDGGGRGAGAALKEAASASASESESESDPSMGDRVDAATRAAREALEAAHAKASLASLGSFLRTALEGLPRVGVGGAFDVARKNRGSDRAALATSLYGSSAFEYAAGFFLSWTVPGPLAAHAAHFTNRFRTAFTCALLAGESPLDPRVVAAALAVCAGADGSLVMDATLATSERRVEVRRREEKASEKRAAAEAEEERERKLSELNSRALAGARMDAAVCKSLVDSTSELRRRAMRAMRSVTDAGVDALREAEAAAVDAARVVRDSAKTKTAGNGRKRSETVAKTVGRGTARSESKPGEIEDVVERAFTGALARETARRVAVVVCGPMWLGATQADFTSVAAGAMSVYACNQSMSLFLPGSSCRGESAEDAAARRALTPSDGAVELTLDVDLDDDVHDNARDGDDEKFGAEESPAAPLRRRALRVRVTLRPVPIAGGVMCEVNRLTDETRKGLDAAGRSITSVGVYAGRATMDGARIASRAIGEVGKNIAGAGEWIGASVTSVASNLASSGGNRPASDGKVERRVAGEAGATVATVATEAAGSSTSPSSSSASSTSFFAGIGAAARSPFASSSSNRSTQPPNAPNQSASSVSSSSFDGPPIVKDVSSLTPAQVEAVISDPAVNAAIGKPSMVMKIMSDRKVVASLRDPRVTKAYMEFTREPCMFVKYKDDERVLALAQRVLELIAESGDEALIEVMDRHDLFQPPPPDAMAMDPREKSAEYDAIAAKYGGSERERNGSERERNESGGWLGGLKIPTVTMPVIPAMGLPSVKVKIPSFGPAAETKPAAAATRKGLTKVATGEASEEDDSDSDEFLDAESD